MEKPKYQVDFPRGIYLRGDTVDGFTCRFTEVESGNPIVPISVCCQIKTKFGKLLHTYTTTIDLDGTVTIPDVEAINFPDGEHVFDVEYTLAGGKKRTYITGTLPIKGDISNCQP